MMFIAMIPETTYKHKTKQSYQSEVEYFARDREQLSQFQCPTCHEHQLFRGGVYIGCTGCYNYFSEKEIIEANISG